MSQQQTKFIELSNEVICCIFDFLDTFQILQSFGHLNNRFNELLKFYIKSIDLSDDGQEIDEQLFQWISTSIQVLKVGQFHYHLLKNCHFPRLHTLNIPYINDIYMNISKINLKKLTVFSKDNYSNYSNATRIPQTITQLSTNFIFCFNSFHANLTHLIVTVQSLLNLTKITNKTLNLVYLSVTFRDVYDDEFTNEKNVFYKDQTQKLDYRLTKLKFLSIETKDITIKQLNTRLLFDAIDHFINEHCPDTSILKRFILQLHRINFSNEIWSMLNQYKTNYSRFDFYGSFIIDKTKIELNTDQFDSFIEGINRLHPQGYFQHIYSLPFVFDKLYGYSSCSHLSSRTSFSSVRHLYFTEQPYTDPISCEFLSKRMPNLLSIHYHCVFDLNYDTLFVPTLKPIEENFNHIHSFYFDSQCQYEYCICNQFVLHLIDRMPNLQNLTTSQYPFLRQTKSISTIEQFHFQQYPFKAYDLLPKHLPNLKVFFLSDKFIYPKEISQIIAPLFINIHTLQFVVCPMIYICGLDETPYEEYRKEALTMMQNMDNRLRNLKVGFQYNGITYYLSHL